MNNITNKAARVFHEVAFTTKKHSPEILIVTGIVGGVAATVMACKATLKVNDILTEHKDTVDKIHDVAADEKITEYTEEDEKKDLTTTYIQTGFKMAKNYAPAVLLGGLSITCILASNNILKKRWVASEAAVVAINNSFKDYRSRVVEKFGEAVDKELLCNLKATEIEEKVTDEETGEEKTVTKTVTTANRNDSSEFAAYFGPYIYDEEGNTKPNLNYSTNNLYNMMFLREKESYANDLLKVKGRLFLNEVYAMLGLPETRAGQVVGWTYDPKNPSGDNYVDFGIPEDTLTYVDYVEGYTEEILLDFNVDGNIWKLM
ncbi:MAG: DUF6353 family protein [Lachnospiraceae bacterium]|nr:DUF6353 family protein [Lachnospiraceae bacterium]